MAGSPKKRARRAAQSRALTVIPQPNAERQGEEQEFRDRWGGKPYKFRPEYIDQARVLCEEGMTDKELARFFGINKSTLYDWQFAIPAFAEAMKLGKEPANDRLERTAFEVAMGYTTTIKELVRLKDNMGNERIEYFEKEVQIPPNPDMLRWMLKNRRPDVWKDKTENQTNIAVIHLTPEQAREQLKAKIQGIIESRQGTGEQQSG